MAARPPPSASASPRAVPALSQVGPHRSELQIIDDADDADNGRNDESPQGHVERVRLLNTPEVRCGFLSVFVEFGGCGCGLCWLFARLNVLCGGGRSSILWLLPLLFLLCLPLN